VCFQFAPTVEDSDDDSEYGSDDAAQDFADIDTFEYIEDLGDELGEEQELRELEYLEASIKDATPKRDIVPTTKPNIWRAIHWALENKAGATRVGDADKEKHFDHFFKMVRENQQERKKQAGEIKFEDVRNSQFTIGFYATMRPKKNKAGGDTDVSDIERYLRKTMSKKTAEILGRADPTGKAFLEIEEVSWEDLLKWGIYISIILDSNGNVIGVYIGSATGLYGVTGRTDHYDHVKFTGKVPKSEEWSAHLVEALKPGRTWHIRPLLLVDRESIPVAKMIQFEGMFTDLCNTLKQGVSKQRWRNQVVLDNYRLAVPKEMQEVSYMGLNGAHQLKQGAKRKMPLCSMQGKGCTSPADDCRSHATLIMFDDEFIYGCFKCWQSWYVWHSQRYTRNAMKRPMTAEQIKKHERWVVTPLIDRFKLWLIHKNSQVRSRIADDTLCICAGPLHGEVEATTSIVLVEGELRISVCHNCYCGWTRHVARAYTETPPSTELKREHWKKFVVLRSTKDGAYFEPDKEEKEKVEFTECWCGSGLLADHKNHPKWKGPSEILMCAPCYNASRYSDVKRDNSEQLEKWKTARVKLAATKKAGKAECVCGRGLAGQKPHSNWRGPSMQVCQKCWSSTRRHDAGSDYSAWLAERKADAAAEAAKVAEEEAMSPKAGPSRPSRGCKKAITYADA
jgi:hypothetical protein